MIGTDFELFFMHEGYCLPAISAFEKADFIPRMRPKHAEHYVDIAPDGYTTYELPYAHGLVIEDGAAVECPCDPADAPEALVGYVREGILATWNIADAGGVDLQGAPLVHLRQEHLDIRPELRILGCSPDIDLYGIFDGVPGQNPRTTLWRTGGGHVHFSPNNVFDAVRSQAIVMLCDLLLGTTDVALEHSPDGKQRREMYGQPGKHRIQPWGVEYRTMSNAWTVAPEVTEAVLGLAHVVHRVVDGSDMELVFELADWFNIYGVASAILRCDGEFCLQTAIGVAERLDLMGYDTAPYINVVRGVSEAGGVVETHGYSLEAWK